MGENINNDYGIKVTINGEEKIAKIVFAKPSTSVDDTTNSLNIIDYAHHEIHNGSHYTCSDRISLNDTDTRDILITTPDTLKWGHMIFFVGGALDTDFDLYEVSTHSAGASLTCINNDRNSENTAGIMINVSAGGGADGNLIFKGGFGSDTGLGATRIAVGGNTRGDAEFILKQNTKYLLRITSNSDANKVSSSYEWYEHTNI